MPALSSHWKIGLLSFWDLPSFHSWTFLGLAISDLLHLDPAVGLAWLWQEAETLPGTLEWDHRSLEVDGRLSNSFQISDGNPLHMRYYIYTSVDHLLFFMWRRIISLSFWVCWEETVDRKLLCKRQTSCPCSFQQGRRLVACCIMLQIPGFETVCQFQGRCQ